MQANYYKISHRFFLVSLGAIPGALFRWYISQDLFSNLFGVFVLGLFIGFDFRYRYKLIVGIGFCGSCTTFSNWIMNLIEYILSGDFGRAIYSLVSNLILGFLVFLVSFYCGKKIKRSILPS